MTKFTEEFFLTRALKIAAAAAALALVSPVWAGGELTAVRVKEPPVIDRVLNDPLWKNAKAHSDFFRFKGGGEKSKNPTTAMVLFDDQAIYIGISCADSNPGSIKRDKCPRDGNIYSQDCVEVMLDPSLTRNRYYHFLVSANGDRYDEFVTQGGLVGDAQWNGQWTAKSQTGPGGWSCVIKIPFFNFAEAAGIRGDWGINICRGKREPNEDSSIAENGVYGNAGAFRTLKGLDVDFTPYQLSLKKPSASVRSAGDGKMEVIINSELTNGTGKDISASAEGWLIPPSGKTVCAPSKSFNLPNKGTLDIALPPVTVTEQGEYTCSLAVSVPKTGVAACQEAQISARCAPVRITLIEPWYRHSIFETQKLENVIFDVSVDMDTAALKEKTLDINITEKDKTIWSKKLTDPKSANRIEISNSSLPFGRFQISAELKASDGKTMDFCRAESPLWKLPYKKGEVWLGKDKNWYADGKPFYLCTGWFAGRFYQPEHTAVMSMKNSDPSRAWISSNVLFRIGQDKDVVKAHREKTLDEATKEKYRRLVQADRDAPNLFAYYLMDEPPGHGTEPESLRQAYETLKEEDPYHPAIVSDDKMPNTLKHLECCDIQAYHPYPPMLKSKRVNDNSVCVAEDADSVNRHLNGKYHKVSLIFMHMGFNIRDVGIGPKDSRIGSYDEFRGQSIMALASGVKGFMPYNRNAEDYPETLIGFPYLTKELACYGPAVLAPESEIIPKASAGSVRMLLKKTDGGLVFFTSNVSAEARRITFTLPGLPASVKALNVVSESRSVPVENGVFSDNFDVCEGHVYTTGPAPALKPVPEIKAEIEAAYKNRQKEGNLFYQRNADDTVEISASSSSNLYKKNPDSALWHLCDGYIPPPKNEYGFMHWTGGAPGQSPVWVEIKMREPRTIGRIEVYPMEKSLKDYETQVWRDGKWETVSKVSGQSSDHITHTFPHVKTDRVRLWITAANGPDVKISEIEAYEK